MWKHWIEIGVGLAVTFGVMIWPDPWPLIKWGGFLIGLLLVVWGVWGFIRERRSTETAPKRLPMWHFRFDSALPFRRLISLRQAAEILYRKSDGSLLAGAAERPFSSNKKPDPIHYFAGYIAFTEKIPIFGIHKVSGRLERIGSDLIPSCGISDDAAALVQHGEEEPIFDRLAIRRADFRKLLENTREKWPAAST